MKTKRLAAQLGTDTSFDRLVNSDLGRKYLAQAKEKFEDLDRRSAEDHLTGPYLRSASLKAAAHAQSVMAQLEAQIPAVSKKDVARLASNASKSEPSDAGLRKAAVVLKRAWEIDPDGSYTAAEVSTLRNRIAGEFPKSTVWALFDRAIPALQWADLPRTALKKLALQIQSQEDYDRLIDEHGLGGTDVLSVRARRYILAQVNESGENDMGLDPDELPEGPLPQGLWNGMQPDQSAPPIVETIKKWDAPMEQQSAMPQKAQPAFQGPAPTSAPMMTQEGAPEGSAQCGGCMKVVPFPVGPAGGEGPPCECGNTWYEPAPMEQQSRMAESEWWSSFKKENDLDEDTDERVEKTASAVRRALAGLRKGANDDCFPETPMFEPEVGDQQDDAVSVGEGGKVAQSLPSKEPPQSLGSSETPSESEFKVKINETTDGLAQAGTSATPTSLIAKRVKAQMLTVEQISQIVEQSGISAKDFWNEAMGGDMAPMPASALNQVLTSMQDAQGMPNPFEQEGQAPMGAPAPAPMQPQAAPQNDAPADAQLGENVEQMVEKHMQQHAPEELAEGHKPFAQKVSRRKVEDLLLDNQVIQAGGFAIRIADKNGKDQIEMVGPKVPPMAWPLKAMTAAIEFFASTVEKHGQFDPKVNQQQPDAVKPEKLGEDSSSKEMEHADPKINGQQPDQVSPDDSMPSNDGEGFTSPSVSAPQPQHKQPGTALPNTDLGKHSSDGEGFSSPEIRKASRDSIREALRGGFKF